MHDQASINRVHCVIRATLPFYRLPVNRSSFTMYYQSIDLHKDLISQILIQNDHVINQSSTLCNTGPIDVLQIADQSIEFYY